MIGIRFAIAPLLTLLVFIVCAGIVWLAHIEAGEMTADRRPPLVKAAAFPLKRSPEDPGGSVVADLGGVGDLLREQPADTEEQLLPGPEQPVTPTEENDVSAGLEAQAALEALVSEIRSDRPDGGDIGGGGPDLDVPVPDLDVPLDQPPPSTSTTDTAAVTPEADATPEPAIQPVPAAAPAFEASPQGRYRIQLAAVRQEADAARAWEAFQQQLGPFIAGLKPFFERAETNNGIFYRVQVGPFAETAEADRLCKELKKQDASCFVVAR